MNPDTQKTAIALRESIGVAKSYNENLPPFQLFEASEHIIGYLAYLISPIMDLETDYRKLVVTYMESGDSTAKAEAKAKASEIYRDWKKLQMLYDLGDEQVKLLKKFSDKLQEEFKRS